MKRAIGALAATLAGVALLVTYKPTPVDVTAPQPSGGAPGSGPASSPAASAAPAAAPRSTPATGGASRLITGPVVSMFFGDVQVRIDVSGTRLTDVQALRLPSDRAQSAYISRVVGPMLRSEAIQAQSANIDIISGATYTSVAYERSLSAALRQAQGN